VSRRPIALIAAACGIDYLLWMLTSSTGPEPLALVFGVLLTVLALGLIAAVLGAAARALLSGWPRRIEGAGSSGRQSQADASPAPAPEGIKRGPLDAERSSARADWGLGDPGLAVALESEAGLASALLQEAALGRAAHSAPRPAGVSEPPAERVSA